MVRRILEISSFLFYRVTLFSQHWCMCVW